MMIHGKQFAILKHRLERPRYNSIQLRDDWVLSYDAILPVTYNKKTNTALIGYAWQVMPGAPSPQDLILSGKADLEKEERTWCGRYAVFNDGVIFNDTLGLFGIFYSSLGISSDIDFLRKEHHMDRHSWKPDDVLRWYPVPQTPYPGIHRLIPGRILDLESGDTKERDPLAVPDECSTDLFISCFKTSLKNLASMFPDANFSLALTGGYDSRTALALAEKSGIDYSCFTLEHDRMPLGDIEYPKKLCEILERKHIYIKRSGDTRFIKMRNENYLRHLSYMQQEEDLRFYEHFQYEKLQKQLGGGDLVLIRSGGWEVTREYYKDLFSGEPYADINKIMNTMELTDPQIIYAFRKYIDHQKTSDPGALGPVNQYYREQRCGGWLSETEHGFTIYDDIYSFQPMNCRILIEMLMRYPEEKRLKKEHQTDLIKAAAPQIADIPFGSNSDFSRNKAVIIADKVKKLIRRLKKIGLKRTIAFYRSKLKNAGH